MGIDQLGDEADYVVRHLCFCLPVASFSSFISRLVVVFFFRPLVLAAGCLRPLLSRRVSNLDTSPFASISARTVPTVVGLALTVSAICRSDFSGVALMSLAMSSRFCSAVRWRRWMLALMT